MRKLLQLTKDIFNNTFTGLVFSVHHLSVSKVTTACSIPAIPASNWPKRISPSTMSVYGEAYLLLILCWTCHVRPSYFSRSSLQVSPCGPHSGRGDSAAGRGESTGQWESSCPSLSEILVYVSDLKLNIDHITVLWANKEDKKPKRFKVNIIGLILTYYNEYNEQTYNRLTWL